MSSHQRIVSASFAFACSLALAGDLLGQLAPAAPAPPAPKSSPLGAPIDDAVTANDRAIVAIDAFATQQKFDKQNSSWRLMLKAPPQQEFNASFDYFWHLETSAGALKIRLFTDTAPNHATSGIFLARLGFYDNLTFHRIIKGFMAQGGCPRANGLGDPGYMMDGEFGGGRKHDRPGLLSMANMSRARTDGSQFFLTFVPLPHLDGKNTIWGEAVDGTPTLKELEAAAGPGGKPAEPPKIVRTWITVAAKTKQAEPPKSAPPSAGGKSNGGTADGGKADEQAK